MTCAPSCWACWQRAQRRPCDGLGTRQARPRAFSNSLRIQVRSSHISDTPLRNFSFDFLRYLSPARSDFCRGPFVINAKNVAFNGGVVLLEVIRRQLFGGDQIFDLVNLGLTQIDGRNVIGPDLACCIYHVV